MGYYSEIYHQMLAGGEVDLTEDQKTPASPAKEPEDDEEVVEEGHGDDAPQEEADAYADVLEKKTEADNYDEAEERRKFDEEEAKRRAEWEAKVLAKQKEEEAALLSVAALNADKVGPASADLLSGQLEAMLKRNLKECITQTVQIACYEDPDFARKVMHPRKSLGNCVRYVNRRAFEYFEQERKDTGEVQAPDRNQGQGIYCAAIPEELCYQWAMEYYKDPFAKEDLGDKEEFVPRTFYPKPGSKGKKNLPKKKEKLEPKPKAPPKEADAGQMVLDFAS